MKPAPPVISALRWADLIDAFIASTLAGRARPALRPLDRRRSGLRAIQPARAAPAGIRPAARNPIGVGPARYRRSSGGCLPPRTGQETAAGGPFPAPCPTHPLPPT